MRCDSGLSTRAWRAATLLTETLVELVVGGGEFFGAAGQRGRLALCVTLDALMRGIGFERNGLLAEQHLLEQSETELEQLCFVLHQFMLEGRLDIEDVVESGARDEGAKAVDVVAGEEEQLEASL